jgi:hypothetical protein
MALVDKELVHWVFDGGVLYSRFPLNPPRHTGAGTIGMGWMGGGHLRPGRGKENNSKGHR